MLNFSDTESRCNMIDHNIKKSILNQREIDFSNSKMLRKCNQKFLQNISNPCEWKKIVKQIWLYSNLAPIPKLKSSPS